jgi:hypothetical protein
MLEIFELCRLMVQVAVIKNLSQGTVPAKTPNGTVNLNVVAEKETVR